MATILNDALRLTTADLKKLGYLQPNRIRSGVVRWGDCLASISITTDTGPGDPHIKFEYTKQGRELSYRLNLVPKPSNLGIGTVWYFRSAVSGKLCRVLYSIYDRFVHRAAYPGTMYQCQTESRKYRDLQHVYGPMLKADAEAGKFYKPYHKTHYKGRPTRKYRRILISEAMDYAHERRRCSADDKRARAGHEIDRIVPPFGLASAGLTYFVILPLR